MEVTLPALQHMFIGTSCVSILLQEDIEEVSRVARQVKNRLERLDKINEQSLSRKVPTETISLFLT